MKENFLRPIIDGGSSRVFDCNGITVKLRGGDEVPERLFFQNAQLNDVIIIKHSVPESERSEQTPVVGTKLYFPFDEHNVYAGGTTIFLHDKSLESALADRCGLDRRANKGIFDQDIRLLRALDRLPTLDPFLVKDVLQSEQLEVNPAYLEIGDDEWFKIEEFIRERFVPLIRSAFPEGTSSHDKTTELVEKLWEGKDDRALAPLIQALRLPEDKAMEIFYAWKVVTFYSSLYQTKRPRLIEIGKWLKEIETMVGLAPAEMRQYLDAMYQAVKSELRTQWLLVDRELTSFETAYQQMFKEKKTAAFLGFLRNSRNIYWKLGDALGKIDHTLLCWDRLTMRYPRRHLNLDALQQTLRVLDEILESRQKSTMRVAS